MVVWQGHGWRRLVVLEVGNVGGKSIGGNGEDGGGRRGRHGCYEVLEG